MREGFIVDEDEEDPIERKARREARREERRKRPREEQEEDEALDEDDLEIIGLKPQRASPTEQKYKRLKRGNRDEGEGKRPRGVDEIFESDEEEDTGRGPFGRPMQDEFAGFIEDDDEGEGEKLLDEDDDVARPARKNFAAGIVDTTGLDEGEQEDMRDVFGTGDEYYFALVREQQEEDLEGRAQDPDDPDSFPKMIELKDVFEPSQLEEKMLTDADNLIRTTDQPERFQIARKSYRDLILTEEQIQEEALWVSNLMWPKKKTLTEDLRDPFQRAIAKIIEFMTVDEYEVPFIFQHRKDYLIHAVTLQASPDPTRPNEPPGTFVQADKLLDQSDLWEIFELDLKFRALVEKRNALKSTYDNLVEDSEVKDEVIDEMLPVAVSMEELQDVQDYLHFQHSARLTDLSMTNGATSNGTHRRPGASKLIFDKVRSSKVYGMVRAFGISADAFAQNASRSGQRTFTEDPPERPDDLADSDDILDPPDYSTGAQCLRAAKAMLSEEIYVSPKLRKVMRQNYYANGLIECYRTEKGLKKIDEQHPYYDFKYLRNQELSDIARKPGRFLRMLKAEEEGLVEVKVIVQDYEGIKKALYTYIESDNTSEIADAWNQERRDALNMALSKLDRIMIKGVKEQLKDACENEVAKNCRQSFFSKLDQAPYKPRGMVLGTVPRVLALSNGTGIYGRDAICWAWVEEDGRVLENGKFTDLHSVEDQERGLKDSDDVKAFVELVERRKPDVIGVSGFSAETRKLFKQLEDLVDIKKLCSAPYEGDDGEERTDRLDVVIVNDEVARLYQTSNRATMEHPGFAPLTKYCVALAKYLQDPMKEYASLGKDIVSIQFDPNQRYLPEEKLLKQLETAMVDMVNLCGVDINEAVSNQYVANLLPYICGLGPRKASQLLKVINLNGGVVDRRDELVADPDPEVTRLGAVGPRVWNNCASFLRIEFDPTEDASDYLDGTRVHPEDYELGRKMAADALELDEEDIAAEISEGGQGAVVKKLIKDEVQDKVNDLVLEEYAEQLERNFNQRKRATLETIRAELQQAYEELRGNFLYPGTDEIFTMFTGETKDSLCEGMVVPVSVRRVGDDHVEARMDCGIEGNVDQLPLTAGMSARQLYAVHQTVRAKITYLNRKQLMANLSFLDSDVNRPFVRDLGLADHEWDYDQERKDKESMQEKNDISGRTQRVIKHPNFHPFNSIQAQEWLGSKTQGEVVIRPSSKGPDHMAVTWKVSDNVYQHIDVLELHKANEHATGAILRVGGKYNYSDLDELIVNHVKAMARKVEEMMLHDKYQSGSKSETGLSLSPSPPPSPLLLFPFLLPPLLTTPLLTSISSSSRTMAHHLLGSQPPPLQLRLLHRPQTRRLFPPLLQSRRELRRAVLAC